MLRENVFRKRCVHGSDHQGFTGPTLAHCTGVFRLPLPGRCLSKVLLPESPGEGSDEHDYGTQLFCDARDSIIMAK